MSNVIVREVSTKADIDAFIEFPLTLFRDSEYFVPPLYADEKKLLKSGGDKAISDSVFFLAERDGKTVGRIQGIIQKQYNSIHGCAEVRFTRFDSIDDENVSRALFDAVAKWGLKRGMTDMVGPLGYSDLDREGLLIEGFAEPQTFEEQYNYEYYPSLVEGYGFSKDVDWLEFELRAPEKKNEMLERVAKRCLKMNKLHVADSSTMSKKKYIEKYRDGFFDCLDRCYSKLYGTVPISRDMQDELISQFMLIVNKKYLVFICDENENVVAFGLCFPSIADALKGTKGRITLPLLIKLLRTVTKPKTIDLALVAVLPEYQNAGLNAVILNSLVDMLADGSVEKCETNLNLETNTAVISQWKHFKARQHKRRRCYRIKLQGE